MEYYQIGILNPKAVKILQSLADLNLITFKETNDSLQKAINRIRKKTGNNPPSLEEITREVEVVREKRNVQSKTKNNTSF
jgi:hypothetical protein